jgi:nucleoside-diphosphate-sugar epimerase
VIARQVRQGQLTADEGVTSFLHVEDAARAALLALDWPPGIVNIVDDEPAKGTVWFPIYAAILGGSCAARGTGTSASSTWSNE